MDLNCFMHAIRSLIGFSHFGYVARSSLSEYSFAIFGRSGIETRLTISTSSAKRASRLRIKKWASLTNETDKRESMG